MAREKMTFEDLVDVIRENGYIKQWKAIEEVYRDEELAQEIVKMIQRGESAENIICVFSDTWHKIGIELSGMTRKEYFQNPDTPVWDRNDCVWNEETEEWEDALDEDDISEDELDAFIEETQRKYSE